MSKVPVISCIEGKQLQLSVLLVVLLFNTAIIAEQRPVPSEAELADQRQILKDILGREPTSSSVTGDREMLVKIDQILPKVADDAAAEYVLLDLKRALAASTKDVDALTAATSALGQKYQVAAFSLYRSDLSMICEFARSENDLLAGVRHIRKGLESGHLTTAEAMTLVNMVTTRRIGLAMSFPSRSLTDEITSISERLKSAGEIEQLVAALKGRPDDPSTNRTAGLFVFAHGQRLDAALPMFARSGDRLLVAIAQGESAADGGVDVSVSLGDQWWTLAESKGLDDRTISAAKRRAAHWYSGVLADVAGLRKVQLQQRVGEADRLPPPPAPVDVALLGLNIAPRAPEDAVIFILDRTGSMIGIKTKRSEELLWEHVDQLKDGTPFNVFILSNKRTYEVFVDGARPATVESKSYLRQVLSRTPVAGTGAPWEAMKKAAGHGPHRIVIFTDGSWSEPAPPDATMLVRSARFELVGVGLAEGGEGRELAAFRKILRSGEDPRSEAPVQKEPATSENEGGKLPPGLDVRALQDALRANQVAAAWRSFVSLQNEGHTVESIAREGVNVASLADRYATQLMERGWHQQAAVHLSSVIRGLGSADSNRPALQRQLERCLAAAVANAIRFGNVEMIGDAVAAYSQNDVLPKDELKARRYAADLDRIRAGRTPPEIPAAAPFLEGESTWAAHPFTYKLPGTVQIGNCKNNRGGDWKKGTLTIAGGAVVEGGTLRASHGSLVFRGTPDVPVVVKNVAIECDYTANVVAVNTIFLGCSFRKTGNWFWNGGFSSKWEFTECMVADSRFVDLSRGNFGLKMKKVTFVNCAFPDRLLNKDEKKDATLGYRHAWNTFVECDLFGCQFNPSLAWGLQSSSLYDCTVKGEALFSSSKDLQVQLLITDGDPSVLESLAKATKANGAGKVHYTPARGLPPKASVHWRLLPALTLN